MTFNPHQGLWSQPNGPFSGTTQVSRYQKGKTNLDFTEARDSEWQWHSFLQAGCHSCHPTNSVKALKAAMPKISWLKINWGCHLTQVHLYIQVNLC